MTPVIFLPAAAADIEDAYRWYEARRTGLGDSFLASIQISVGSIQENPGKYPVIHRNTRRALVRRFPYGLFFVEGSEQIVAVACFHVRQDPRRWDSRIRGPLTGNPIRR